MPDTLDDNLRQIAEDLFMRGVGSAGLEDIEDADDRDKALLNLQAHYSTEAIAQIKQAFADEGYVQMAYNPVTQEVVGKPIADVLVTDNLMTGQE